MQTVFLLHWMWPCYIPTYQLVVKQYAKSLLLYNQTLPITSPAHTHTQPFNGLFSRTTWVGRYQKDKPFRILLKQEMTGWQWHRLNHMQIICTSLQTDNHASTSSLHIFTGRMPFLLPNQQRQSTEGNAHAYSQMQNISQCWPETHVKHADWKITDKHYSATTLVQRPFSRTTRVGQYQKDNFASTSLQVF